VSHAIIIARPTLSWYSVGPKIVWWASEGAFAFQLVGSASARRTVSAAALARGLFSGGERAGRMIGMLLKSRGFGTPQQPLYD
jgi:hypothetical protein